MTTTIVIVVGIIIIGIISFYNRFIRMKNRVDEAWADIDVQLKRRYDLIPNLVQTVKGYAAHEQGTFEKITDARSRAMNATGVHDKEVAENMLSGTLKSLFALSENYPDLKANTNFLELQRELADTENKIQAARRFYNTVVRDFNTGVQTFPGNLIAKPFNFTSREFFELTDEEAKNPVAVSF